VLGVKRGFVATGLLIGGVPQSGGQTMSAFGGVSHIDNAADPAATRAATVTTTISSRAAEVERTAAPHTSGG
jgi:hypothetical protein